MRHALERLQCVCIKTTLSPLLYHEAAAATAITITSANFPAPWQ